jgi:hypothetical protein
MGQGARGRRQKAGCRGQDAEGRMQGITLSALSILILVATVGVLAAGVRRPVTAQGVDPQVFVSVGFDGYCRSGDGGAWCPTYVVVSNEGADIEGELQVTLVDSVNGPQSSLYTRSVLLPSRSRKAYHLYVPAVGTSSRSRVSVSLQAGQKLLASHQVSVAWMGASDRLYGVASSRPSTLDFLSGVAPTGGRAAVAHLDLRKLPPDPLGWEGLDLLILSDVDTSVLSGSQRKAMDTWLAHGGHLVVGGGAGAGRTVSGVEDLLPVTIEGTRSLDELTGLGEQIGISTVSGPFPIAQARLRAGETMIAQEGDDGEVVLWARRTFGEGVVDFLAFEAGVKPFEQWDDNGRLWELIVGTRGPGAGHFTVSDGYRAREAVDAIPGLELPSTLQILGFMLAYTILIGPVNYVLLRKLDRRELAWLTIPVLIVGFSACAYATGFQIRGLEPIVHRLAVVFVPAGSETGRVGQVVGVFSPRRANYDVWMVDAGVREIASGFYGGTTRQPLVVIEEAAGATVTDLRVDVGGIYPFIAEGYAPVSLVSSDLRLSVSESGELEVGGTLQNGEIELKDAVIIAGNHGQQLGDLRSGDEVNVHLLYHNVGSTQVGIPEIPERILGPGDYWDDRELYRKHQFLEAVFAYDERVVPSAGGSGYLNRDLSSGVYLVGWADQVPLSVAVVGRSFSTSEVALYVYRLAVAGPETDQTISVPPDFVLRQVEGSAGEVNVWPEGFHLGPESEITFRFTIWPEVDVKHVDELVLDLQGSSSSGIAPSVSLWHEERASWERLEVGWGTHPVRDAEAYVSSSGSVLIRLEAMQEAWVEVHGLTVTLRGHR